MLSARRLKKAKAEESESVPLARVSSDDDDDDDDDGDVRALVDGASGACGRID